MGTWGCSTRCGTATHSATSSRGSFLPSVALGHSCVKSSTGSSRSRSRSWLHLQKQARSSKLTQLCRLIWHGITIFQCVVYQYEFFRMFFILLIMGLCALLRAVRVV